MHRHIDACIQRTVWLDRFGHWSYSSRLQCLCRSRALVNHGQMAHSLGLVAGDGRRPRNVTNKKADVEEHPKVFDHVGLLSKSGPPVRAGCPSSSRPTRYHSNS